MRSRESVLSSCVGRRMSDTALHLVERVFPEVPIRQWVCSLPCLLRVHLGYDMELCADSAPEAPSASRASASSCSVGAESAWNISAPLSVSRT